MIAAIIDVEHGYAAKKRVDGANRGVRLSAGGIVSASLMFTFDKTGEGFNNVWRTVKPGTGSDRSGYE